MSPWAAARVTHLPPLCRSRLPPKRATCLQRKCANFATNRPQGARGRRRQRREAAGPSGVPPTQLVVEGVALHRDPARVADDADELLDLLLGAGGRAGGAEDLLAHDRALDVVRAEVERDLGERHGHRDPVRLDVRDVVEQQPRDGDHLQVVGAGLEPEAAALEDGVLRVERERDEREEAAGPVLLVAQAQQVVDALLVGLDVAVEDRAVRRDPEPVRGVVDVEPHVRVLLARRDEAADAVGEDLGAAAGQRAEARRPAARAAPARA